MSKRVIGAHKDESIVVFLATLDGQTTEQALANLEQDARLYGWSRAAVRKAASVIRLRASESRFAARVATARLERQGAAESAAQHAEQAYSAYLAAERSKGAAS